MLMYSNKNSPVCLILWWSLQMHRKYMWKSWRDELTSWLIFYSSEHICLLRPILRLLIKLGWSPSKVLVLYCSTLSLCSSQRHYRRGRCVPHARQCRCPRRPWWCSCWPPPPCCGCSRRRGLTRGTDCWCPAPRQPGTGNIWNARRSLIPGSAVLGFFHHWNIFLSSLTDD